MTLSESQLLVDAGVDPNTADMVILHEEPYETSETKFDGVHQILCVPYKDFAKNHPRYKNISYFPAWSLECLLDVIPDEIIRESKTNEEEYDELSVELLKYDCRYSIIFRNEEEQEIVEEFEYEWLTECCVHAIVWLKTNKYI